MLVSPERRRRTVSNVRSRLGPERVSEPRACCVFGQPRNTQRYESRRVDDEPRLLREMRLLARQRPPFGSGRIHRLLTQRGWTVNEKRVQRLWKREHMQVPRKQHRNRARYKNHVWSYDFVTDRTEDGRQLRLLVVIDEYTRECFAIEVGRSFTAQDVIGVLQYLFAIRGTPEHIRSDNGPEFVSTVICRWLKEADVKTLFIVKGSPWENSFVEPFNGTFRDELLNREIFLSFDEACWVNNRCRLEYNHHRIHSSLDYQTPAAYAAGCVLTASATPQPPEPSRLTKPNPIT